MYSHEVKQRAYTKDPECWISYAGKPKAFKQLMDIRRIASLDRAQREIETDENIARENRVARDSLPDRLVDAIGRYARAIIDYERSYRNSGSEGPPQTVWAEQGDAENNLTEIVREVLGQ